MGILARLSLKTFTALALSLTPALFAAGSAEAAKGIRHEVPAGKSSVLTVPAPIERVSVTDPEIADVLVISATELQINGKKLGSTSLIIWDKQKNKTFFDIEVVVDISELKDQIKEVAPGDEIIFRMLSPDTLVVSGKVSTEERKTKIHNLLLGFGRDITEMVVYNLQGGTVVETRDTGGIEEGKGYKFVMLLEISDPVQVLLQITVAAIDRNATKSLGINVFYIGREVAMFSSVGSSAPFNVLKDFVSGSRFGPGTDSESTFQNNPNFGVIHAPSGTAWLLKALAGKGLAKILAEPNLIVKSGSSGKFLAGGEFPIPVVTSASAGNVAAVSVVYKEYGVKMHFTPIVRETGIIELGMGETPQRQTISNQYGSFQAYTEGLSGIEVSSLDFANSVTFSGFRIPALKKDAVSTSVDLREGESFIIAGLLREEWSKNLNKFPILGDIPIIGAFFREQSMQKTERELVFIITPKVVQPMAPGKKAELPGMNEPTPAQLEDLRWIPMLPTKRSTDTEQLK